MDGRNKNNLSRQQRREAIYRRRKAKPKTTRLDRLEAAKNVLRRTGVEVYEATMDDPRAVGFIRVGARKRTPDEVMTEAAAILTREATRQRELRAQYGLKVKR